MGVGDGFSSLTLYYSIWILCVYRIGHITLDWGLITSLVERWRLETHTFHLPIGEMTITLQDVAVILGLRIHGLPITGTCDID